MILIVDMLITVASKIRIELVLGILNLDLKIQIFYLYNRLPHHRVQVAVFIIRNAFELGYLCVCLI